MTEKISDPTREQRRKAVMAGLKKVRDSGMSREEMAAKAHVSFSTMNSWLSGRRIPRPLMLDGLQQKFRISFGVGHDD